MVDGHSQNNQRAKDAAGVVVSVRARALDNLARDEKSRGGRSDWSIGGDGLRVRRFGQRGGGSVQFAQSTQFLVPKRRAGPLEGSARCLGSFGSSGSSGSPQTRSLRESKAAILHVDLLDGDGDGQDLVSGLNGPGSKGQTGDKRRAT